MKIDFRYLQYQGITVDTRKTYYLLFDPLAWGLLAVYDSYNEAFDATHYSEATFAL